jgi:hypothetical protein
MPDGVSKSRERSIPGVKLGRGSVVVEYTGMYIQPYRDSYGTDLGTTDSGTQITVSEGHPWPPRKGQQGDIGGDFSTAKSWIEVNPSASSFRGPKVIEFAQYSNSSPPVLVNWSAREVVSNKTPLLAVDPSGAEYRFSMPPYLNRSDADLMKMGAVAVSRCSPTNSVADVSTFLGETLREGIPRLVGAELWKSKTAAARRKAAGGEYLNVEFGWKPMVSDIRKIASAISHAERVLAQYEKDAGKQVRRRYRFPSETKKTVDVVAVDRTPYGYFHSDISGSLGRGKIVRTVETERHVWFSGAFTYYLPTGYDSRSSMMRNALLADKLFGVSLTPEVLWNLTPWSWAVDWFTNAGDVLSNVSSLITDGLLLRYGYIMEHTVHRVTYTWTSDGGSTSSAAPSPVSFVAETKNRRRANPFGFGVTWDGLSPRQIAIAAALALSRGK